MIFGHAAMAITEARQALGGPARSANALFVLNEHPAFLTKLNFVREWLLELLARAVLLDVPPLARRLAAAAAGDGIRVHRGEAVGRVSLRAHHVASARRSRR